MRVLGRERAGIAAGWRKAESVEETERERKDGFFIITVTQLL